jgi:hypothetical protein
MGKTCYRNGCKKPVAFVCNCDESSVYSCSKHISDHLMFKGDHSSIKSFLILLSHQDSQELYPKLIKTRKDLEVVIRSFQKETHKIVDSILKESQKTISSLKYLKLKVSDLVKKLQLGSALDKENLDEVNKIVVRDLDGSNKNQLLAEILRFYELHKYICELDKYIYESKPEIQSTSLCFFKDQSKNLTVVSIDKSDFLIPLNISTGFNPHSAYCKLPDDNYFFYGGCPFINDFFIIDVQKKTVTQKKSAKAKGQMGCCYYKNKVTCLEDGLVKQ